MVVDYHTHTNLCKHAEGDLEQYILKAIDLGLDEVGCSDHSPMPGDFDERHRMSVEQFHESYTPAVMAMAEKYKGKIIVKRGLEAEFHPGHERWVQQFIKENAFDFVIGSVHFIVNGNGEKELFGRDYDGRELESLYEEYYRSIRASAASGMFDIVAHFDLVKKLGRFESKRVDELIREAMGTIKQQDLCLEINTSGFRRPERETYPSEDILRMAKELGIPLTLGSDAHKPEDVGSNFETAIGLVEQYGNGNVSIFTKRERSEVKISRLNHR